MLFFWENLLFADWKFFTLQKIAILSGVVDVDFIIVLALQQKLFCCLKAGVLHRAHVFMMTNFPLLSKSYLIMSAQWDKWNRNEDDSLQLSR